MKLSNIKQIDFDTLFDYSFDIFFAGCGYETRGPHFSKKIFKQPIKINRKIALHFTSSPDCYSARSNKLFFEREQFTLIAEIEKKTYSDIFSCISKYLNDNPSKNLNILVDYSSMTKTCYSGIVNFFKEINDLEEVNIFFTYTQAEYCPPAAITSNRYIEPIPGFSSIDPSSKPAALVLGLGYEKNRAIGLIEYLQINDSDIYIFYTDSFGGNKFSTLVKKNNEYLLNERISKEHQFEFPLYDMNKTNTLLSSICSFLIDNQFRVILAPLGPKPFALLSLLLALKYPQLNVYRVSEGENATPTNRIADTSKDFIIYKTTFIKE